MYLSVLDQPAPTMPYFIAGYAVILGFMLIYLVSLAVRSRNLKQDLQTLEELEKKEK